MESPTVVINEQEFEITPLNARKTAFVSNLLGKLLIQGKLTMKQFKELDPTDLPFAILAAVDETSLVELAAALIGSDVEFAKENFDLVWVTDALVKQVEVGDLGSVITNFTVLVGRIAQ